MTVAAVGGHTGCVEGSEDGVVSYALGEGGRRDDAEQAAGVGGQTQRHEMQ